MRNLIIVVLAILSLSCKSQNQELENRSVDFYFNQIAELEYNELVKQKVLIDSLTIAEEYLDEATEGLNEEGYKKYVDIKMNIYRSFFKDYLYQQHIGYKDNVYVLYFSMAGFDDIEWHVIEWNKEDWKNEEKLPLDKLGKSGSITEIFWNYDEGPKNLENIKIHIYDDYLVLERGHLYHSLFDLRRDSLLINVESPWHSSNAKDKEEMNDWIKTNLHDKIEQILKNEEN